MVQSDPALPSRPAFRSMTRNLSLRRVESRSGAPREVLAHPLPLLSEAVPHPALTSARFQIPLVKPDMPVTASGFRSKGFTRSLPRSWTPFGQAGIDPACRGGSRRCVAWGERLDWHICRSTTDAADAERDYSPL